MAVNIIKICCRQFSSKIRTVSVNIKPPDFDTKYLCPENTEEITININQRKGVGNVSLIFKLQNDLQKALEANNTDDINKIKERLIIETNKIPNASHPSVTNYGEEPKITHFIGEKPSFQFKPRQFDELSKKLNVVRTEQLGNVTGHRSYYFLGDLAELEQAIIRYVIKILKEKQFQFLSVPDILPREIIERCGMNTKGDRTQVYFLDPSIHGPDQCLSGTAEMSIAGYLMNKVIPVEKLPMKIAAVSRCYRAETSNLIEERGVYRVHQFTKVEMFGVTEENESESFLEEFRKIQEHIFSSLGLYCRVLDMPPHELGAPAYRKFDIEAWMPGRGIFGEISSCSDCTDYQTRRLHIKYNKNDSELYAYSINGTACAIPRTLMSILETYQQENGTISIPPVLIPLMKGKSVIYRRKQIPQLKLIKL